MEKSKLKKVGEIRRVDELGRVIIPSKLRQELGLSFGSLVEFFRVDNKQIIIRKSTVFVEALKKIWEILNCFKTENNKIFLFDQDGQPLFLKQGKNLSLFESLFSQRQKQDFALSDIQKKQFNFMFCHFVPIYINNEFYGFFAIFDNKKNYEYKPILQVLETVLTNG